VTTTIVTLIIEVAGTGERDPKKLCNDVLKILGKRSTEIIRTRFSRYWLTGSASTLLRGLPNDSENRYHSRPLLDI
jgi:hypothetical protein